MQIKGCLLLSLRQAHLDLALPYPSWASPLSGPFKLHGIRIVWLDKFPQKDHPEQFCTDSSVGFLKT